MILQNVIPVVNGIHSAIANMECCSVMITDPAPHHDILSMAIIVITFSTPRPHPQLTINIPYKEMGFIKQQGDLAVVL